MKSGFEVKVTANTEVDYNYIEIDIEKGGKSVAALNIIGDTLMAYIDTYFSIYGNKYDNMKCNLIFKSILKVIIKNEKLKELYMKRLKYSGSLNTKLHDKTVIERLLKYFQSKHVKINYEHNSYEQGLKYLQSFIEEEKQKSRLHK